MKDGSKTREQLIAEVRELRQRLAALEQEKGQLLEKEQVLNEELQVSNEELHVQAEELRTVNEDLEVQAEELQAQNEELQIQKEEMARLASFPQINPFPVLEIDAAGNITFCNPAALAALEKLGVEAGPGDFLPEDLEEIQTAARQTGERYFYREVRINEALFGENIHYAAPFDVLRIYASDITARRQAEEALRRAKEEWELTFNAMPDLIAILDDDHGIVRANRAMAQALGKAPAELAGLKCYEHMHGATCPPDFCPHSRLLADGQEHVAEVHELGRDFLVTASPLSDDQGRPIGSVHVARDITERKRAEAALRQSREDLNHAQAVAHTGSWRLDVRRNELLWSDENHRIFGIPQGTPLTYEAFLTAVHPEDREYVDRKWTAALRGEPYDIEHRIIVGDSVKWVRERAELEFDSQGQMLGGFGTTQDITERKRAEAALRQAKDELEQRVQERTAELQEAVAQLEEEITDRTRAEEGLAKERQRFYDVLEMMPAYVVLLTPDYHVPFANRYFVENFGESQGRRCFEYLFGRTEPCEICETYSVLKTKAPHRWEWTGPNGHIYDIHDFPFTDADGSPLIMEVGIDITERKRAEAALEDERRRLFEVLERIPAHVSLIRPDHSFAYVNGEFVRRFGEPEGRRCYELIGQPSPCAECQAMAVFQTGAPVVWEWTAPNTKHYQIYDYPFTDLDGSPLVLEMGVDLTDRKEAEEEIKKLNEELETRVRERTAQLEAANKELEAFSYSVSHDLKAPIRAIEGFSRILMAEHTSRLDAEGLRFLDVICANTRIMAQLIDDLLALARLGRQTIRKSVINLTALTRQVFAQLRDQAPQRDLRLTVGDLPPALGDPSLINQVVMNLLTNAIKYTKSRESAAIEVGGRTDGQEAIYYVKDNGVGFDGRYAHKLFGVFQRLHGGGEYEGTGVGLAIVQRIVQRHGGRVWAESELNEGATFYFSLPKGVP